MERTMLALAVVGLACAAACGGDTADTPDDTTTADPAVPAAGATRGPGAPVALSEETEEEACPTLGTWEGRIMDGPFAGEDMRLVVDEEGAVQATAGPNVANQSWALYEDILTVQNRSDAIWTGVCDTNESATYEINMSMQCTVLTLAAQNEPCDQRRATMDGLELSLQ